jgi:23S rRNA (guanosine2251-2'-O)-methyltransferase
MKHQYRKSSRERHASRNPRVGHVRSHQYTDFGARVQILDEDDLLTLISELKMPPLILVLDGVQDPQNLGAIFRTADAAGVHVLVAPKDRSVGITETVRRVACGAAEKLPFAQVTNLARVIGRLKEMGVWVVGTSDQAPGSLYEANLTGPLAIVVGFEGKGMRRLTMGLCDSLVAIPMSGSVESLNVSVATGICLFEAVRQRKAVVR